MGRVRLGFRDPASDKYVGSDENWQKAEASLRRVLEDLKLSFEPREGEAAFYGPKIDVQIFSAIGREFSLATNQVDFAVPPRFNLTYVDKDGQEKVPLCIHRAPLSTSRRASRQPWPKRLVLYLS